MGIRIGINGFGRIGRVSLRAAMERGDMDIVAINAPDKLPEQLAYIFKFDTVHGRYKGRVTYDEEHLYIDGRKIALLGAMERGSRSAPLRRLTSSGSL
jgi:glyceraldehyde 3-phosphate dehydrogenase